MLNAVAAEHESPIDRFWAVTQSYLAHFACRPALTLLWFDDSIAAVQARPTTRCRDPGPLAGLPPAISVCNWPRSAGRNGANAARHDLTRPAFE
ncbi:hypothetical protein A5695_11715 [Mycobacterium sp. E1747]|nr:hypothetical protein A5695_11715 [Mycobacterium sp. E1747]